ncbi:MAG: hypothetical protein JWR24_3298, partial [Actinoallomurus sp.]|nr:hypothetical protein [Actinoallomurus sp.]
GVLAEVRHAADAARGRLEQRRPWTGHPREPADMPDDDDPGWAADSEPRVS